MQTLLTYPLRKDGYEVVAAHDGREALDRFAEQRFDLVVLDIMLPKLDGIEVCRRLRSRSQVPIIMLTAKDDEIDKVARPRDGRRRLHHQAVLGPRVPQPRQGGAAARGDAAAAGRRASEPIAAGELRDRLRAPRRRASAASTVQLTYVEFEILAALARAPGPGARPARCCSSRSGATRAYRDPRTIDVHIRHLREKLERDPRSPEYLFTVRGVGYRFRDPSERPR